MIQWKMGKMKRKRKSPPYFSANKMNKTTMVERLPIKKESETPKSYTFRRKPPAYSLSGRREE